MVRPTAVGVTVPSTAVITSPTLRTRVGGRPGEGAEDHRPGGGGGHRVAELPERRRLGVRLGLGHLEVPLGVELRRRRPAGDCLHRLEVGVALQFVERDRRAR